MHNSDGAAASEHRIVYESKVLNILISFVPYCRISKHNNSKVVLIVKTIVF